MVLRFLADSVENPANRERIVDAADLLGASGTAVGEGRLIAVENAPQARDVYGRRPLRGTATLALGHERRGVPQAVLAAADEILAIPTLSSAVTTLNVAAAAAVAGWYVLRGSGPQRRAAHPAHRHPSVLLSGDDHVEVGSSLRSAAAFGLKEVFLDDRGAGWFDGPHAQRREARAAARRHKNPLRVRRAPPGFTTGFDEIVVVTPCGPGRAPGRQPLARGRRQLIVIGQSADELEAARTDGLGVTTLGLQQGVGTPLRLIASIALAEIARQAGRRTAPRPAPGPRRPAYEREVKLVTDGELLLLDSETLLRY